MFSLVMTSVVPKSFLSFLGLSTEGNFCMATRRSSSCSGVLRAEVRSDCRALRSTSSNTSFDVYTTQHYRTERQWKIINTNESLSESQTPVISVTWSFRNQSYMLICCSRNISSFYNYTMLYNLITQCWITVVPFNILWKAQYASIQRILEKKFNIDNNKMHS